jgi:hypothetical protein
MPVKVLAFFDTRYQSANGGEAKRYWRSLVIPPLSKYHQPVGIPTARLGTYDLAVPEQAAAVVQAARQAGLDGFIVDCRKTDEGYVTEAACIDSFCDDDFGIAFRWNNPPLADVGAEMAEFRALVAALLLQHPVLCQGCPMLIVGAPQRLADPARSVALLRAVASGAGLPGLYLIANVSDQRSGFLAAGFDALLDPDPSEWASTTPFTVPSVGDPLEISARLEEVRRIADRLHHGPQFLCSRMVDRGSRGKVFPRVFPQFNNWVRFPSDGATMLTDIEPSLFASFLEKAMHWAGTHLPDGERFVFLDSWNDRGCCSEVEPSTRLGEALLRATAEGIQRGAYAAWAVGNVNNTPVRVVKSNYF